MDERDYKAMNAEIKNQTATEWLAEYLCVESHFDYWNAIKQAKEMEAKQKYSIDFIKWYSGMNQKQIENAHDRFLKETFKSK